MLAIKFDIGKLFQIISLNLFLNNVNKKVPPTHYHNGWEAKMSARTKNQVTIFYLTSSKVQSLFSDIYLA